MSGKHLIDYLSQLHTSDHIPVNHCGQLSFWQASLLTGFKSGQLRSKTLKEKI